MTPLDPSDTETATDPEAAAPPPKHRSPQRGDILDRYVVVDHLGTGGMGSVYRAYDPELDRGVAIKLVRSDRVHLASDRQRILREARAIAKLSHPNVVSVYDVGEHAGSVFIVMELVHGTNLADWSAAQERSSDEVCDVYRAAGAGIVAAHAAGVLHRDIKPRNILVGSDGRVRVADFGLARALHDDAPAQQERELLDSPAHPETVTQAGALVGSPAYMAPERLRGQASDERSDQFSFCLSMFETLTGARPSRDASGAVSVDASPRTEAGSRVRNALVRGMATDPASRFPTVAALLAALEPPRRRAYVTSSLFLGVAVLAAAALILFGRDRGPARCTTAAKEWRAVWNDDVGQKVRNALGASSNPYTSETFQRVAGLMDAYGDSWMRTRTEVCRATFVTQTASTRAFDLKQTCLQRRLTEVGTIVSVWLEHGEADSAVRIARSLTSVDECTDEQRLAEAAVLPDDRAARAEVESILADIERADALSNAGKHDECVALAESLSARAEAIQYPAAEAPARLWLSKCLRAKGQYDEALLASDQAIAAAVAAGDDEIEAKAWLDKRFIVISNKKNVDDAIALSDETRRSIRRAKDRPTLVATFESQASGIAQVRGDYDAALEHLERARSLYEEELGPDDLGIGALENNIGNILNLKNQPLESRKHHERALEIKRIHLAPQHPSLAISYTNLGHTYRETNDFDLALEHYERALAVLEVSAPKGSHIAAVLGSIGVVHDQRGDYDKARIFHQRALDHRLELHGPDNISTAFSLSNLAGTARKQGRYEESAKLYEHALRIRDEKVGRNAPRTLGTVEGLAETYAAMGEFAKSRALYERLLRYYVDGEAETWAIGATRFAIAKNTWNLGDKPGALRLARRALREMSADGGPPDALATATEWVRERE